MIRHSDGLQRMHFLTGSLCAFEKHVLENLGWCCTFQISERRTYLCTHSFSPVVDLAKRKTKHENQVFVKFHQMKVPMLYIFFLKRNLIPMYKTVVL